MIIPKILLLTSAIGAAALAAPATADGPQVLHFRAETVQTRLVDVAPPRPSLGDSEVASGLLVDGNGRTLGRFGTTCTRVGLRPGLAQCDGWGTFPGGRLTVAGLVRDGADRQLWAITGGTGSYRAARGELRLEDMKEGQTALTATFVDG
jgi:hypothetical protein